ncbi:hypothetical protein G6F23_014695 [Rhizopus arrhizus]|nr:hypothetical protein G6F23_014695 [Rhizopus arrhizus]
MQVKLLRAIQEKSVRAVGAPNEEPVDVRILSATHRDLAELVEDGRFRHDLYYRINVIELKPWPRHPAAGAVGTGGAGPVCLPRQGARAGDHPGTCAGTGRGRLHRCR